jgi:hypothetical protein
MTQAAIPTSDQKTDTKADDLPDWLKGDEKTSATLPGEGDELEQRQKTKSKASDKQDDEDDGSDPYGFGEYSLGNPT